MPALVYTMYDGYYIYTPFTNTLTEDDYVEGESTYQDGERIYGLKPYVFYSCRYVKGNTDVVITYSLDNYITVQGKVGNEEVYKAGYLLDNISISGDNVSYRGATINTETLTEQLALYENSTDTIATKRTYNYVKINGVKYYEDTSTGQWFSMLNGVRYNQETQFKTENDSAKRYYQEAFEFTNWVRTNLGDLTTSDAVDENGNHSLDNEFGSNIEIFGTDQGNADSIEDSNSLFNQHRLSVIRYSIEKNLSIAIANYNRYATSTSANFQMPELQEDEWEKIINNVSIISFMQGLSIGGKIYNGYSIVTNTKTEEVVNLDSIYIITSDGYYHRATDSDLSGKTITGATFNVDFERKSITNGTTITYYYPHEELGCYNSIVNQSNLNDTDNIYEYIESQGGLLAEYYFTALGRERYGMYKTFNNSADLLNEFTQ